MAESYEKKSSLFARRILVVKVFVSYSFVTFFPVHGSPTQVSASAISSLNSKWAVAIYRSGTNAENQFVVMDFKSSIKFNSQMEAQSHALRIADTVASMTSFSREVPYYPARFLKPDASFVCIRWCTRGDRTGFVPVELTLNFIGTGCVDVSYLTELQPSYNKAFELADKIASEASKAFIPNFLVEEFGHPRSRQATAFI